VPVFSDQCHHRVEEFTPKIELGLTKARPWLRQYLRAEKNTTARFRLDIVFYELGQLMRMLVYRDVARKSARCGSREDLRTDIGDAVVNLLILAEIVGVDGGQAVVEAFERLQNKEWRKH
jgi:hypothetical protein